MNKVSWFEIRFDQWSNVSIKKKVQNPYEDIDNEKIVALVARLGFIRMFHAYTQLKSFKLFQMDVKNIF